MTVVIWHASDRALGMYECTKHEEDCDEPCYVRSEDNIALRSQLNLAVFILRKAYAALSPHLVLHGECYDFLRSIETCEECNDYDRVHDARCKLHPDHDPTPE